MVIVNIFPGRIRIAHVPYAMSLALAKKKVNETMAKAAVEAKTAAQTTKGSRVAHIPQVVRTSVHSRAKTYCLTPIVEINCGVASVVCVIFFLCYVLSEVFTQIHCTPTPGRKYYPSGIPSTALSMFLVTPSTVGVLGRPFFEYFF